MSQRIPTHESRIAVLEAMSDADRATAAKSHGDIMAELEKMQSHMDRRFDKLEQKQSEQEEKLKEYENKGRGIIIGAGLAGVGLAGGIVTFADKILGLFK